MSKITSNSNRAKYTFLILEVLDVKWYADAMRCVERCCEDVTAMVEARR